MIVFPNGKRGDKAEDNNEGAVVDPNKHIQSPPAPMDLLKRTQLRILILVLLLQRRTINHRDAQEKLTLNLNHLSQL